MTNGIATTAVCTVGLTVSALATVSHSAQVDAVPDDTGVAYGAPGMPTDWPLGNLFSSADFTADGLGRVAQHQPRRGQVVDGVQLTRHHQIQLVGGAVDEQVAAAELALRLEVRQRQRAHHDQHRDQRCRAPTERL